MRLNYDLNVLNSTITITQMCIHQGEECKTRENLNFSKKWQNGKLSLMYKLQNWNFSRSRMMKRTSPLDSSREIYLPRRISLNYEIIGFSRFLECLVPCGPQKQDF